MRMQPARLGMLFRHPQMLTLQTRPYRMRCLLPYRVIAVLPPIPCGWAATRDMQRKRQLRLAMRDMPPLISMQQQPGLTKPIRLELRFPSLPMRLAFPLGKTRCRLLYTVSSLEALWLRWRYSPSYSPFLRSIR